MGTTRNDHAVTDRAPPLNTSASQEVNRTSFFTTLVFGIGQVSFCIRSRYLAMVWLYAFAAKLTAMRLTTKDGSFVGPLSARRCFHPLFNYPKILFTKLYNETSL